MDYGTTSSSLSAAELTMLSSIFLFFGTIALIVIIISIVAMWRIFAKAGEPGWKALIPIYNSWIFLRLGNQAGWWALVALIPLVNIVAAVYMAIAAYHVALKLGKEGWYVVLYLLVPLIWLLILAFDKSTWNDTETTSSQPATGAAPEFVAATDEDTTPPAAQ